MSDDYLKILEYWYAHKPVSTKLVAHKPYIQGSFSAFTLAMEYIIIYSRITEKNGKLCENYVVANITKDGIDLTEEYPDFKTAIGVFNKR